MVQPLPHGLLQVVARTAERGVAAGDELVLLALQRPAGARTAGRRLADHLGVHGIDLAVEIGELRIGADRLLHGAPGGGAIEARLVVDRHQRAQPLQFLRQRFVIAARGRMIGVQLDRGTEIGERAGPVALPAPEFAPEVEDIGDYDTVLRLDPTLADVFNFRGELWRRKGDRPRALADFGAAIKLNPNHAAARGNYKSLAQELERLGALMAVYNKPSFDCATARRPVEKAICANPELANLDREINAVNAKVVREAASGSPRAGRALQREQDEFIARRDAAFGRPGYDLQKAMRERLDHLLAIERY